MARRKTTKKPDYTVGYRRPPKDTQFRAGQSGNPKGRPKGSRSVGAVLQDIMQRRVSVSENGNTRRLPVLEVLLRKLTNDAMRSDQRAIKLLLSLLDRYGEAPNAAIQLRQVLAEDETILAEYLRDTVEFSAASSTSQKEGGTDNV